MNKASLIKWSRALMPFGLAGCIVLVFFADVIFSSQTFFFRDLAGFHYPHKYFWRAAIAGGELPLWNPGLELGLPNAGELVAAPWYIPNLVFLFLSPGAAIKWFIIPHYLLAALAVCGLNLICGCRAQAAVAAGCAYALSGYLVGIHWNLPYFLAAAWLPLVILAWHQSCRRATFGWRIFAALCLAALIIVGDPMMFCSVVVTMLIYIFTALPRRKWLRGCLQLLVTVILALGAAAIQLIPAYELYQEAARAMGLRYEEIYRWSFAPARLIEYIYPFYFKTALPWPMGAGPRDINWVDTHYFGLIAFALAVVGLTRLREPIARWLLATATVFLFLALGGYTPVYRALLAVLPALKGFRYPEKYMAVTTLALCLAAARGFQVLISDSERRGRFIVMIFMTAAAVLSLFLIGGDSPAARLPSPEYGVCAHVWVLTILMALLITLLAKKIVSTAVGGWLITALFVIDLFMICGNVKITDSDRFYLEEPPTGKQLKSAAAAFPGPFRIYYEPQAGMSIPTLKGLPDNMKPHYWRLRRALDFIRLHPNTGWLYDLQYANGFSPLAPRKRFSLAKGSTPAFDANLDVMNVRVIIAGIDSEYPEARGYSVIQEYPREGFKLILNRDCLPRAFLLTEDSAAFFLEAATISPDSSPLKLLPEGLCRITSYRGNCVNMEADLPANGWLILADRYFSGWRVTVDGCDGEIKPFAGMLRAVALNQGRHRVQFSYRPLSLVWGGAITAATLGIILLWGAKRLFRLRQRPRSANQLLRE